MALTKPSQRHRRACVDRVFPVLWMCVLKSGGWSLSLAWLRYGAGAELAGAEAGAVCGTGSLRGDVPLSFSHPPCTSPPRFFGL